MKNYVKKFASLLVALMMFMGMTTTAFAASTGMITINNATDGNIYKVYKVFDAVGNGTNISYKLVPGKSNVPAGFKADAAGNVEYNGSGSEGQLTQDDITAIAEYVKNDEPVETVIASGTTATTQALENGYYYITTTTGTAVTVNSANPNVTVNDKNVPPVLDKKITGVDYGSFDEDGKKALAEVGSKVTYTATIEVKAGAVGYVFHDKMDSTLSYNNDVTVKVDNIDVSAENYDSEQKDGDTITLSFKNDWIKNQVGKTITISYSAIVTDAALSVNAAKNTAKVDYGHNGKINSTPEKATETYNAKFTVTKTDGEGVALAGAGFVISKTEGSKTVYYKKDGNDIKWVENIDDATEMKTTDESNVVTFTGLANGTYNLIEKTVPAGYNKAADKEFTIEAHNYEQTNLEQAATVVNNAGAILPSTGGMGTIVIYILGAILFFGAAILLIAKKCMKKDR